MSPHDTLASTISLSFQKIKTDGIGSPLQVALIDLTLTGLLLMSLFDSLRKLFPSPLGPLTSLSLLFLNITALSSPPWSGKVSGPLKETSFH